jgi:hypothetical protein
VQGVVEYLQVDGGEMMVWIGVELALVLGERLDLDQGAGGVGIGLVASEAVDVRVSGFECAEHVVEGSVLHHENNDVLEALNSG